MLKAAARRRSPASPLLSLARLPHAPAALPPFLHGSRRAPAICSCSRQVGSFDAGYGATHMARLVGQKKAREVWFLCRLYDAQQVTGGLYHRAGFKCVSVVIRAWALLLSSAASTARSR